MFVSLFTASLVCLRVHYFVYVTSSKAWLHWWSISDVGPATSDTKAVKLKFQLVMVVTTNTWWSMNLVTWSASGMNKVVVTEITTYRLSGRTSLNVRKKAFLHFSILRSFYGKFYSIPVWKSHDLGEYDMTGGQYDMLKCSRCTPSNVY